MDQGQELNVEYYELQYWTYGAIHVERFLNKATALKRVNFLSEHFKKFSEDIQYTLVKCELCETNSDIEWYKELLENGYYGYTF